MPNNGSNALGGRELFKAILELILGVGSNHLWE